MTFEKLAHVPDDQIRRWVAEGLTAPAIARLANCNDRAVTKRVRSLGLSTEVNAQVARGNFGWTPERVEEAKRLYEDGLSCSQIARKFGITRNSVIGKLHRLGITRSPTAKAASLALARINSAAAARPKAPPVKREARPDAAVIIRMQSKREEAVKGTKEATPRRLGIAGNGMVFEQAPAIEVRTFAPSRATESTGKPARMTDDHFGGCRWPINEPPVGRGEETVFCCGPRPDGAPYCADHARIAYQPSVAKNGKRKMTANEYARSLRRYL